MITMSVEARGVNKNIIQVDINKQVLYCDVI